MTRKRSKLKKLGIALVGLSAVVSGSAFANDENPSASLNKETSTLGMTPRENITAPFSIPNAAVIPVKDPAISNALESSKTVATIAPSSPSSDNGNQAANTNPSNTNLEGAKKIAVDNTSQPTLNLKNNKVALSKAQNKKNHQPVSATSDMENRHSTKKKPPPQKRKSRLFC